MTISIDALASRICINGPESVANETEPVNLLRLVADGIDLTGWTAKMDAARAAILFLQLGGDGQADIALPSICVVNGSAADASPYTAVMRETAAPGSILIMRDDLRQDDVALDVTSAARWRRA